MITFFDTEIIPRTGKVSDIGAVRQDGSRFHRSSQEGFTEFLRGSDFVCGHNVIVHDMKYVGKAVEAAGISTSSVIDTLYLSPLLFPKKPYHALLKDDKLQTDELNNPLNDAEKAKALFDSECNAFNYLDEDLKYIYYALLGDTAEFGAFFRFIGYTAHRSSSGTSSFLRGLQSIFRREDTRIEDVVARISERFRNEICTNSDIAAMCRKTPVALAYSLALIDALAKDPSVISITPRWVMHNYPEVGQLVFKLRNSPCLEGCPYCNKAFDIHAGLRRWFGFDSFRTYGDEPLQENAVRAAVDNRSLLAVFPTGGGKSLTFQLPALMSGQKTGGLTVVISPLQSLMKDQVDNLEKKGITEAVTVNGLLDPIERSKAVERIEDGSASILYISPESLRSKTIERLMLGRNIVRFVIDEAHCFSSWGQDFRVDYLYIAEFIRNLQKKKGMQESIPVSCFTATAKVKVIEDIRNYFRENLSLEMELFTTGVSRHNLHYTVLPEENEDSKYQDLRRLIEERDCPVIVYVTRTKKAEQLASRLVRDGFRAKAFHGKMDAEEKTANQDSFMSGETRIIVATSAFGMGVDKSDVGLVVHYQISDSLENYVQEAGRAGRDEKIEAECYVLFNEDDLSSHFLLLNQTKLTMKEIQQVWKAVKEITRTRMKVSNSALEIARKAGWDDSVADIETRVRTAIASLEQAGYLRRGQNMPRVYATGILARTAQEAIDRIDASHRFDDSEKKDAVRIIKSLISSRSVKKAQGEDAESRVDYLSDRLALRIERVVHIINLLREEKILADTKDLVAYIGKEDTKLKSRKLLKRYYEVEKFLLEHIDEEGTLLDFKVLNEEAESLGKTSVSLDRIKLILNFWAIKGLIKKVPKDRNRVAVKLKLPVEELGARIDARLRMSAFIIDWFFGNMDAQSDGHVEFSVLGLMEAYGRSITSSFSADVKWEDIEDALFYLSRIGAISIEGGFMVLYNAMTIERLEKDNHRRYRLDDYQRLNEFYTGKTEQIHIVGEYAKKMIDDYVSALQFVDDYFHLNYNVFISKYFNGRKDELSRNMTPEKFRRLFGDLSASQLGIIKDKDSRYIVVAAGPGSGKTRVLVHKLASLLLMEDVKHEQLLMLTFSRAAATEFRQRLHSLIGNAVSFVDIMTFHSYCFDLLGRVGSLEKSADIVRTAVEKIRNSEVDVSRITKTVLVIDEAQDMDEDEFELVKALIEKNEDLRILAVGDDDQNIYSFRGSSSEYMEKLLLLEGARKYELVENFRSSSNLVAYSNAFVRSISHRIKSSPVLPVRKDNGDLELTLYSCNELAVPLVESLTSKSLSGSVAVLTQKNDEAIIVAGLLQKKGIPAQLIQSNQDFRLSCLVEIMAFKENIGFRDKCPTVDPEAWNEARRRLKSDFSRSSLLPVCLNLVDTFLMTCPESSDAMRQKMIYKSDFETFLSESSLEDFIHGDTETVVVSTIHKSKGKEFDNVFLLLDGFHASEEEKKRQLYVALTRARNNLYIYLNTPALSGLSAEGLVERKDTAIYGKPSELSVQLTMKDVWLNDFKSRQFVIGYLMSGGPLFFSTGLSGRIQLNDSKGRPVLQSSMGFLRKYDQIIKDGYHPVSAEVSIILWWKGEDMETPLKVVLPMLHFGRD